jgi:hypothetical protein
VKLTRRQEEFINKLIDLSIEFDGPIHYSILGERLGVSPFTAYDMLCLLEEKGVVTSEYQLAADKNGPGRAERLFYPNPNFAKRKEVLIHAFGGRMPGKEEARAVVMAKLLKDEALEKGLTEEMLARLPEFDDGNLAYCVEIMSIVAARLRSNCGGSPLLGYLPELFLPGEHVRENLSLLAGAAFGALAQGCVQDQAWLAKLFGYLQQYLQIVQRLSRQDCNLLAETLAKKF